MVHHVQLSREEQQAAEGLGKPVQRDKASTAPDSGVTGTLELPDRDF